MNAEKLYARFMARMNAALLAFAQANDCEIVLGEPSPNFAISDKNETVLKDVTLKIELREKKTEP